MNADLDQNIEMFERMAATGWDTMQPLRWGYFFMDSSEAPLSAIERILDGEGYRLESVHQAEDGTWVLQMSKVETLTPETLHARNVEFNQLAKSCGAELYDGWDVGLADN